MRITRISGIAPPFKLGFEEYEHVGGVFGGIEFKSNLIVADMSCELSLSVDVLLSARIQAEGEDEDSEGNTVEIKTIESDARLSVVGIELYVALNVDEFVGHPFE